MNEEKRQKESLKKQKKIILIVIASLILFVILYFLIGLINFDSLFKKNEEIINTEQNPSEIFFYNEIYSQYPSNDEWYMEEADKTIDYVYTLGPMTHTDEIINEDDAKKKSDSFYLLYKFIEYVKAGDAENYNKCFSQYYFNSHEPQAKFTKQKIYDIIVTELATQTKYSDGILITEYNYLLEYRIRHNNGSLRKDIGSDFLGKQQIKISDRSGEGLLIDDIIIQ